MAANGGHEDIVEYLVDVKKADFNLKDGFGVSTLATLPRTH